MFYIINFVGIITLLYLIGTLYEMIMEERNRKKYPDHIIYQKNGRIVDFETKTVNKSSSENIKKEEKILKIKNNFKF